MDRGWYVRFVVMVASATLGFLALWPSVDRWFPAPDVVKSYFENAISPSWRLR